MRVKYGARYEGHEDSGRFYVILRNFFIVLCIKETQEALLILMSLFLNTDSSSSPSIN